MEIVWLVMICNHTVRCKSNTLKMILKTLSAVLTCGAQIHAATIWAQPRLVISLHHQLQNFNDQMSDFRINLYCTLCVVLRLIKCLHPHRMNRVASAVITPRCHTPKKMREDAWRCQVSHRFLLTDSRSHPRNDSDSEITLIHFVLHKNIWYWFGPGRHPETCKDPFHLCRDIRTRFYSLVFFILLCCCFVCAIIFANSKTVKQTKIPIFWFF